MLAVKMKMQWGSVEQEGVGHEVLVCAKPGPCFAVTLMPFSHELVPFFRDSAVNVRNASKFQEEKVGSDTSTNQPSCSYDPFPSSHHQIFSAPRCHI